MTKIHISLTAISVILNRGLEIFPNVLGIYIRWVLVVVCKSNTLQVTVFSSNTQNSDLRRNRKAGNGIFFDFREY